MLLAIYLLHDFSYLTVVFIWLSLVYHSFLSGLSFFPVIWTKPGVNINTGWKVMRGSIFWNSMRTCFQSPFLGFQKDCKPKQIWKFYGILSIFSLGSLTPYQVCLNWARFSLKWNYYIKTYNPGQNVWNKIKKFSKTE